MNKKMGRNDPCPCGSGKKYKNCCIHEKEEQKKVYTPSGKRKFKAKVIDSNAMAVDMMSKVGVPSVSDHPDLLSKLRFRMTDHDYRPSDASQERTVPPVVSLPIEGETITPQYQPGDEFKIASDDFRLEEK